MHDVFAQPQRREPDRSVEPGSFLRSLLGGDTRRGEASEQWPEGFQFVQRLFTESRLQQLRREPHADRKVLDWIGGFADHATEYRDEVRLVRAEHHARRLLETDCVCFVGDGSETVRHHLIA
jgi:hypothetical protein